MTRLLPFLLILGLGATFGCSGTGAEVELNAQTPTAQSPVVAARAPEIVPELQKAEYPHEFTNVFSTAATTLVPADKPGRYKVVQDLPGLGVRRTTSIAVHSDHQFEAKRPPIRTPRGFDVYPMHMETIDYPGGHDLWQSFFIPYESLDANTLEQLGVQRRAERRSWSDWYTVHAQSPGGIVIAMVVSTTGSGGSSGVNGPTLPPGSSPTLPPGTSPTLPPGNSMAQTQLPTSMSQWQNDYLETLYPELPPDARLQRRIQDVDHYEQWMCETRDAQMANIEKSLYGSSTPEAQMSTMLQQSGTVAQQTARAQGAAAPAAQSTSGASGAGRVAQAVAVAQAIAQWGQQALDWLGCNEDLKQAKDCYDNPTNPTAQNAKQRDPANYKKVGDQLAAAESANNWNTGVRALNTGNALAGAFVLPGPAAVALDIGSSGSDAMLREVTLEEVGKAVRGVTGCGIRWITGQVTYTYSLSQRTIPPLRGPNTDYDTLIEVVNGMVRMGLNARGQIVDSNGSATYRMTETGGFSCKTYNIRVGGRVDVTVSGNTSGFKEVDAGGKKERVGIWDFTLAAAADDLDLQDSGTELLETLAGQETCRPYKDRSGHQGANVLCDFKDAALLQGGSFFSDSEQSDKNPNHTESRSCRIDVRP